MLGNTTGLGSFSEPATQTTEPTVTPVIVTTPAIVPTITLTPEPYEQLIPAQWNQYKTALVEIWLPSNFKLADKKTIDRTNKFAVPELLITEIPSKSSAYNMVVGVSYDVFVGDLLDKYLDAKLANLPQLARVADRKTVSVNSVEARRIVIEARVDNIDENHLVYVFLDGSTVWYVEYAAEISEFFENLPIFEQSIQTFRVAR